MSYVEDDLQAELRRTTGQIQSCVLEGRKYNGKFKAKRTGDVYGGGSGYYTYQYVARWWEGSGVIEDLGKGKVHQFLFSTRSFKECKAPKYVYDLQGSISNFKATHDGIVEKPDLIDEKAVIDLTLENLLDQLKKPQEGNDPIQTVVPESLQIFELMGKGLIKEVSVDQIIDAVYFNLEKSFNLIEDRLYNSYSKVRLRFLDQYYQYGYEGFLGKSEKGGILLLKISPEAFGHKTPLIMESDMTDLRLLDIALIYTRLDEEKFNQIQKGNNYHCRHNLDEMLSSLIIQEKRSRIQQILIINGELHNGQLAYKGNKILFTGEPITRYKIGGNNYDGKIVPCLIESTKQRMGV